MSIKIGASTPSVPQPINHLRRSTDRPSTAASASDAPAAAVDTVHLTGDAVRLQQADQAASKAPEFDAERVQKTRAAIAAGTYVIDAQKIAAKLARLDQDLTGQ